MTRTCDVLPDPADSDDRRAALSRTRHTEATLMFEAGARREVTDRPLHAGAPLSLG
jgi:hypothetical protein